MIVVSSSCRTSDCIVALPILEKLLSYFYLSTCGFEFMCNSWCVWQVILLLVKATWLVWICDFSCCLSRKASGPKRGCARCCRLDSRLDSSASHLSSVLSVGPRQETDTRRTPNRTELFSEFTETTPCVAMVWVLTSLWQMSTLSDRHSATVPADHTRADVWGQRVPLTSH